MVLFFPSNFVLSKFRKNVIRKNGQSTPIFERTKLFFRNEFRKNDRRISKERYSIKQPAPHLESETLSVLVEIQTWHTYFGISNQIWVLWHRLSMFSKKFMLNYFILSFPYSTVLKHALGLGGLVAFTATRLSNFLCLLTSSINWS